MYDVLQLCKALRSKQHALWVFSFRETPSQTTLVNHELPFLGPEMLTFGTIYWTSFQISLAYPFIHLFNKYL